MRLLLGFLLVSYGFSQPIVSVQNAAANTLGVAPGSLVAVRLGTLNPDLSKVRIEIRPEGSAGVFIAQPVAGPSGALWAVLPSDLPVGVATVTVSIADATPSLVTIEVVPSAFGVFSVAGSGFGPALAQNDALTQPPTLNQLTNPVVPGQYVTLWGTGLGALTTPDVTVEIAGTLVKPTYAGHAPTLPGVNQINFPLPGDTPDGCYIPLTVRTGNASSNEVTIAKSGISGSCPHPLGLTAGQEATLDQGGTLPFGFMSMSSSVLPGPGLNSGSYTRGETLEALFTPRSGVEMALISQPQQSDARYFSCSLKNGGLLGAVWVADMDAGASLTLTGPAGQQIQVGNTIPGLYVSMPSDGTVTAPSPDQLPPAVFTPGTWQVSGPGGTVIRAFLETLALPPPLTWTNRTALKRIGRTADVPITWDPQGYSDADVMTATLSAGGFQVPMPAGATALGVSCRAPARDGRLVLPAAMLAQIPATPGFPALFGGSLTLTIGPRPSSRPLFNLPLTDGGSLPGVKSYTLIQTERISIQ